MADGKHGGHFDDRLVKSLVDMIAAHIHVKESVLATFDGPTLQHAIKQMNGERLRRLPRLRAEQPDRDLLW